MWRPLLALACVLAPFWVLPGAGPDTGPLLSQQNFGTNPGNLTMWYFAPLQPQGLKPALVVALHGCAGSAQQFAAAGFNSLAERHGFFVLYPEQKRENHPYACFNHSLPNDEASGRREMHSVMQMVHVMVRKFHLDSRRVFITGFSSGGLMASMLAAKYPSSFRAGATIGASAYSCESGHSGIAGFVVCPGAKKKAVGKRVRRRRVRWPRMSIWHAVHDQNVPFENLALAVTQWKRVHGILRRKPVAEILPGDVEHEIYRNKAGAIVVESFTLNRAVHAVPVSPGCGETGAFREAAQVCFAREATRFFGLHKEPITAAF